MLMTFLQQNQSRGQNGTCLKLRRGGGEGRGGGQDGEMTQTMYAHNKKEKKSEINRNRLHHI
jgi:hypothetical protein